MTSRNEEVADRLGNKTAYEYDCHGRTKVTGKKASYNSIGQLIAEKWYNSADTLTAHYKYVHDGEGNIVRSIDVINPKEYARKYCEQKFDFLLTFIPY